MGAESFVRLTAVWLKGKSGAGKSKIVRGGERHQFPGRAMNPSDFLRIERDDRDGSRHYVVHTHDPKFTLELTPDGAAPDKIGRGVIKRIHVPNSWAGDYTKYSKFVTAAQEFFEQSFGEAVPKLEMRRHARRG